MTRTNYYARRAARIQRLEDRAVKASNEATATHGRAHAMAAVIPFGQPILVGHHSEGRDRRYRARIDRTFRKSFEAQKQAQQLAGRAHAAAANHAISSDAPDAPDRVRAKIAALNAERDLCKAINAALRKKGPACDAALAALSLSPKTLASVRTPDSMGRIGFPAYVLTNLSANIRRYQKRLAALDALAVRAEVTPEIAHEVAPGVRIVENAAANRLQVIFPGKPEAAVRAALKAEGFRWSPTDGAWQRQLSNGARAAAERALTIAGVL